MRPLGIAITTFNRRELVTAQIALIRELTSPPFYLVVCDDGSTDGTAAACVEAGVTVIAGENRGVAWNKNRGIWHLLHHTDCDPILLLDDDVLMLQPGWDGVWRRAAQLLGHANAAFAVSGLIGGHCTPEEPGLARQIGGHTIVFSRAVLSSIGYMDVRFGQYGHEHVEHSMRAIRTGHGGVVREGKFWDYIFSVVHSDIALAPTPSSVDPAAIADNTPLLHTLHREDIYRLPWRNEQQRLAFLAEQRPTEQARGDNTIPQDFDGPAYLALYPDVGRAGFDPLYHFLRHGRDEGRPYRA